MQWEVKLYEVTSQIPPIIISNIKQSDNENIKKVTEMFIAFHDIVENFKSINSGLGLQCASLAHILLYSQHAKSFLLLLQLTTVPVSSQQMIL
jgi:CRISPR/Cas system-associated endonuclease Cas3-HD